MTREHSLFALWAAGIVTAATAAILYQHWLHTQAIVGAAVDGSRSADATMPGNTIAATPGSIGVQSPATGIATPLGLGGSVFAFNPPQTFQ
jgi:hypothetical protein